MANLPVTNRPTDVIRCWPSSTSRCGPVVVAGVDEVDQPERVALEQGVDHGDVLLAVVVDVVPLELRLDDQVTVEAEQALTLQLVVDETLGDLGQRVRA
jgi:hypothetical protein